MTDRGYNNFYTPDEYESYQQFHRTPTHEEISLTQQLEELSKQISELISLQEESIKAKQVAYCELCNGDHPTGHCPPMTDVQFDQMIKQMANKQSMKVQTNPQTTHENDNILKKNEECGESVEEVVEKGEEERKVERSGVVKKVKEMDTPHEVELPQEIPCIEKVNTVDSEKEVMDTKENDGLFDKEESYELKKEIENKAEIDRVIDEICALFHKNELGRIWTPQHLYLKFMEFLPNQRKKTDDVLSVSFWPP
ncbi:hypothetical protein P8452_25683 [Trifolium repens]|nr:hypothetical protein QL285_060911 [Trifolium repens]KAK2419618.1 hypothetical protein QL285_030457 [Trifolium repens]WJX35711.1 hypothetical protein P8452_23666 [Trifolium repens]WJX37974.1 hypothetical protein P8452_25683 [Trifolium repens]